MQQVVFFLPVLWIKVTIFSGKWIFTLKPSSVKLSGSRPNKRFVYAASFSLLLIKVTISPSCILKLEPEGPNKRSKSSFPATERVLTPTVIESVPCHPDCVVDNSSSCLLNHLRARDKYCSPEIVTVAPARISLVSRRSGICQATLCRATRVILTVSN